MSQVNQSTPPDAAGPFDVLLRGGHVIDPANGRDGVADVGIADGKIARIGPDLDAAQAK